VDGTLSRLKLGNFGSLTLSQARSKAGELESSIEKGANPKTHLARERHAARSSRELDRERLVEIVITKWKRIHFPGIREKTREMYDAQLSLIGEAFGGRDISTISRGELARFLDSVRTRTASGVGANHAASTLRQLFRHAEERLDLERNPAATLRTQVRPSPRKRVLEQDEIRVLWQACIQAGYPYGHALRFSLCTGQRIGECGAIRRSDLDSEGNYWSNTENKADRRIDIYLAPLAQEILDDCPHFSEGDHYFSASSGRLGIRSDTWSRALQLHVRPEIPRAADFLGESPITDHWTPHDLRRTVRSGLTGWCGVLPDTAERVLNHAIGGLRAHYDYADYRPHVRDALEKWDGFLSSLLEGKGR
jgi:integrase